MGGGGFSGRLRSVRSPSLMFSPPEHSPYIPDQIFCRRSNVGFPGIFLNICSCILCFGTCKNIIPVQCASRSEELKSDIFKSFQNYTIKIQNIIHQRVGWERREESVKTIGSLASSAEHLSIINSTHFFSFSFFCSLFISLATWQMKASAVHCKHM